jgi:hypothetical protein
VINRRTDTTVFGTSGRKVVIERRGENTESITFIIKIHQRSSQIVLESDNSKDLKQGVGLGPEMFAIEVGSIDIDRL